MDMDTSSYYWGVKVWNEGTGSDAYYLLNRNRTWLAEGKSTTPRQGAFTNGGKR